MSGAQVRDQSTVQSVSALPANVAGLRTLLANAVSRGIDVAAELRGLVDEWLVCPGNLEGQVEHLAADASARLPAYCRAGAPAARWVRLGLSAAFLQGLRSRADAPEEDSIVPGDPATLLTEAEPILRLLLAALQGQVTVPGANRLLARWRASDRLPLSERWESRSHWIRDGGWYRLVLRRVGADVHFYRQRAGRAESLLVSVGAEERPTVSALLKLLGPAAERVE